MKRLLFVCILLTLLISGVLAQEVPYNAPDWTSLPLTNVTTGETFTLADYAGKVVFVEPMATWCTNCRAQLGRLNGALNQFDNSAGNFLFLGVSVELGLDNAALASYQANQGFNNINFAVASTEFLQGLIDTFGRAANTPPSTPHFYIFPDGTLGNLVTGPESADELVAQFQTIAAETSFAQPADPEPTEEAMMEATEEMTSVEFEYNAPDWTSLPLTNVATGETFTLSDYAGKIVFLEPMATWCTNCRAQLGRLNGALNQFDNSAGNFLFLGVSVELGLDDAALASYQTNQGFNNINFAVASPEFLQGLIDTFGRAVNTPPSTPHFYIFPDGSLGDLVTGPESVEELVTQFETLASETTFYSPEDDMVTTASDIPYSAILFRTAPETARASFFIGEDLNGQPIVVEGTTDQVAADVIVDFVDPNQSQVGTVLVNARTLTTDEEFRNRALRSRILFSAEDQYEFISFEPTALNGLPEAVVAGEAYDIDIIGNLTIVDTTLEVTFDATVTVVDEDTLQALATTEVLYADFGLTIPSVPGVANVTDEVTIELEFTATAVEKAE